MARDGVGVFMLLVQIINRTKSEFALLFWFSFVIGTEVTASISEGAGASSTGVESEMVGNMLVIGGNSRVDVVETTKVLKHTVTECYVVTWFPTEQTILLSLEALLVQPGRSVTDLPCCAPIVPSWGGC